MPDATILVKGISRLLKKVVSSHPDLSFRLSLARNSLLIDTVPTQESVSQYSEHALAELEQLGVQSKKKESSGDQGVRLRKMEEQGGRSEEGGRGRGKPREDQESKKAPCRFFLSDQGCRRGKQCPFGHVMDNERRCWGCGAKDHLSNACPRSEEGKTAKVAKAGAKVEKQPKQEPAKSSETAQEVRQESEVDSKEDTMKVLLEEANRMIKQIEGTEVTEKRASVSSKDSRLLDLQNQLEALRKVSLRPFRISKMGHQSQKGLIDSGATHPLRPRKKGEMVKNMPKVSVMLAGDQEVSMRLSPQGTILGDETAEPIVPMGMLASVLECQVCWTSGGMLLKHPQRGVIPVMVEDGCPMVPRAVALQLIQEMEDKVSVRLRMLHLQEDPETSFIERIVSTHPLFQNLPTNVKEALIEKPAEGIQELANRRTRKLWRKGGLLVHAFSGAAEGYTLRRALHEVGGDRRLLYEFDVVHGKEKDDLSVGGRAFPLMLRLALDGWVKGWIGGPPCRTRSVLRHRQIEGLNLPRPVRTWNGGEYGKQGLTPFEKDQVFTDDVLMMRFLLLYVISEMVRKSKDVKEPTTLLVEQPAEPERNEDVVSLWRTKEWKVMEEIYGVKRQTFDQSEFGADVTKPTTLGGNVTVHVPLMGRKGRPRSTEGKSEQQLCSDSRALSRWPPGLMRAIAIFLQERVLKGQVKMRALSWSEHVRLGHTPFRRDCRTCQLASARDYTHRRSKLPPKIGVLSLDTAGPLREAPDLGKGKKARYLLVGAFTWIAREGKAEGEVEESLEVPEDAPVIEEYEDEDQRQESLEDEKKEAEDEETGGEVAAPEEGEEIGEEREDVKVEVTRICVPLPSRNHQVVLKAIVDIYLRLKADGYSVVQLHTDRGGEYTSVALEDWCRSRDVLHTLTPGDSPQSNGRAEVAVQQVKAEIRRALHGAGADFNRWPLAARFVNEVNRLKQTEKSVNHPPFLSKVLIRKRYWRSRELEPTQEEVLYLGPSWVNHGHWVEREGGAQVLTRMIMHGLKEAPTEDQWIGLEDSLNPLEERRRLRGKIAVYQCMVEKLEEEEEDQEREEERQGDLKKVIEEEMVHVITDPESVIGPVTEGIADLKEQNASGMKNATEELLQTRIVPVAEVRKEIDLWKPAIQAELDSMFKTKTALVAIKASEVKELIQKGEAEVIPSKLVCSVKPCSTNPQGKRKIRLVACGNFAESLEGPAELFASGATAVALRVAVTAASQEGWEGIVLDVKAAFLNAPMNQPKPGQREAEAPTMRPILKPPPVLVAAKMAQEDEYWEAVKAVYGYRKSPRLWGDFRDQEIMGMKIVLDEKVIQLRPMVTEPNLWRIVSTTNGGGEEEETLEGLLLVYVDDLLVFSSSSIAQEVVKTIQAKWETSDPQWIGQDEPTRFLGTELWKFSDGSWKITQINYTLDLLKRNLGGDPTTWKTRKIPMLKDPEVRDVELPPAPDQLREAQRIVGELVWLSARSRPDLIYCVAKMSSLVSRDPEQVIQLADQVWGYLAGTYRQGLRYQEGPGTSHLNIFTDSSFNDVCQGCVMIFWGNSLLLWKSGKQPVLSVSTAESELIELMEGACSGEAVRVVLEEVWNVTAKVTSFTDNAAAITIVTSESGSWRTRHLRKRASAVRTKVLAGEWAVRYQPGAEMPADLGTKTLASERFEMLKRKMGMEEVKKAEEEMRGSGGEEKKESPKPQVKAATKRALQALILVTKIAQVDGFVGLEVVRFAQAAEKEDGLEVELLSRPASSVLVWLLIGVTIVALILGVFIGMHLSNREVLRAIERVQRPSFLEEEVRRQRESTAPLPGGRAEPSGTQERSAAASSSAAAASSSAAGRGADSSSAAGRGADSSSAAGRGAASSSAAVHGAASASAADPSARAAAAPSSAAVAPREPSAAAGSAASNASEPGNATGVRQRRHVPRYTMYISDAGERVHSSSLCHGLRKAKRAIDVEYCPDCVPHSHHFEAQPMFSTGEGDYLHKSQEHLRACGRNDPIRKFWPCQLCFRG